jgi:hypothetical protein
LKTYLSRARSALGAYADWSKNPVGWSPKKSASSGAKKEKRATARVSTKEDVQDQAPLTPEERTLDDEISEALLAIARWPKLRPFLMKGLTEAMTGATK